MRPAADLFLGISKEANFEKFFLSESPTKLNLPPSILYPSMFLDFGIYNIILSFSFSC